MRMPSRVKISSPSYPVSSMRTLFSLISNWAPVLCLQLPSTPCFYTVCNQAPGRTFLLSFISDAAVFPDHLPLRDWGFDPYSKFINTCRLYKLLALCCLPNSNIQGLESSLKLKKKILSLRQLKEALPCTGVGKLMKLITSQNCYRLKIYLKLISIKIIMFF